MPLQIANARGRSLFRKMYHLKS